MDEADSFGLNYSTFDSPCASLSVTKLGESSKVDFDHKALQQLESSEEAFTPN